MLKFRTYMSDRSRLIKLGEVARELARKTDDPQKFILDFAEKRFPHLYEPLLEAFYLEVDGPSELAAGEKAPAAPSNKGDAARPASEIPHGGILDWLKDLFGGGGAAKNFDKALKSITKVDSVVKTIKIPDDLQADGSGSGVEGYDQFSEELTKLLQKMQELGKKSTMLQVADAIKRDPNYVQELQNALAGSMEDADLKAPADPEEAGGNDPVAKFKDAFDKDDFSSFDPAQQANAKTAYAAIKAMAEGPEKNAAILKFMQDHGHSAAKKPVSMADKMKADQKPVKGNVVGEEMHKATNGDFSGFGANADEAKDEWERIKNLPNEDPKKHERWAYVMRYYKHNRADEVRRQMGKVLREGVFTEAMVLAGIPARRRK